MRLSDCDKEIRELERQLREKKRIKQQITSKINKIDDGVREVKV